MKALAWALFIAAILGAVFGTDMVHYALSTASAMLALICNIMAEDEGN